MCWNGVPNGAFVSHILEVIKYLIIIIIIIYLLIEKDLEFFYPKNKSLI